MNQFRVSILTVLSISLAAAGCGKGSAPKPSGPLPVVVFCQASSSDPWRRMYDSEMAATAQKHVADYKFEEQDASGDANKQISQIKDVIAKKPKVLMVSPVSEAVLPEIDAAHDAGIFVFLLDMRGARSKADSSVGANLSDVMLAASSFLGQLIHKKGTILIVPGPADSYMSKTMVAGFHDFISHHMRRVTAVDGDNCDFSAAKAKAFVSQYLLAKKPADGIFAVTDDMAIGAADGVKDAHATVPYIFGVGACEKSTMDAIKSGTLYATFTVPPGGPAALDMIPDLINGAMPPKESIIPSDQVTSKTVDQYMKRTSIFAD